MIAIKQQLVQAVQAALDLVAPSAGLVANLELPKVAAHGDFAITAAMQLAKPLGKNPRAVGEDLMMALKVQPAVQQWVSDVEMAGPGFINLRLSSAAKQQVVGEVLA
ncbi:MAG: arginine--tRNA ligase, partial [Burkholderiaceae bacterium]